MLKFVVSIICLFFLIKYLYKIRKETLISNNAHPQEKIAPIITCNESGISIRGNSIFWQQIDFIHFSNNYNGNNLGYYKLYPLLSLFKLCGIRSANNFENSLKQIRETPEKQTLLIFVVNKRTPFIVNLQLMPTEQAREFLNKLNRYNSRIDLWKNKLQKIIWN